MAAPRVEAIVFDFDGLLVDTEKCLLASWEQEWRHHGLQLDVQQFWVGHGGDTDLPRYAALAAAVGPDFDLNKSVHRRSQNHLSMVAALHLQPGVDDWLAQAKRLQIKLAIASSSSAAWVSPIIARLKCGHMFDAFAFGDEVSAPKPSPEVYQLALSRLGLAPSAAIAVEDSFHGLQAARAAGLACIAVPNPAVGPRTFVGAHLTLDSLCQMNLCEALGAVRESRQLYGDVVPYGANHSLGGQQ
jgi:putative hydrolase of the HAD superfamily